MAVACTSCPIYMHTERRRLSLCESADCRKDLRSGRQNAIRKIFEGINNAHRAMQNALKAKVSGVLCVVRVLGFCVVIRKFLFPAHGFMTVLHQKRLKRAVFILRLWRANKPQNGLFGRHEIRCGAKPHSALSDKLGFSVRKLWIHYAI